MANIGDTCVSAGNRDWFIGDSVSVEPSTVLPYETAQLQRGGSARISAGNSYSGDALDILHFVWRVVSQPSGAQLEYEGEDLDLLIDEIGEYEITLTAIGANGGCGAETTLFLYVFSADATQHAATALDTSWVWQMLPSAWSTYPADLRLKAELFWRGLTQIIGSDLTKAYAFDVNKGISSANQRRPARWINASLVEELTGASLLLRADITHDITQRASDVEAQLSGTYAESGYSKQIQATLIDSSTLRIDETSGMMPLTLDEGGELLVTLPNRVVRVLITAVDMIDGRAGIYSISPALREPRAGDVLDATFTSPNPDELTRLGAASGRGLAFRERRRVPGSIGVEDGYLRDSDLEVKQSSAIVMRGLWDRGVRPDDILIVEVSELTLRSSTSIKLRIIDVLTLEDGLDYALFEPFAGTYQDIAQIAILGLVPGEPDAVDAFSHHMSQSVLKRAYGFRLSASSEFTIVLSNRALTFRISFTRIIKRSAFVVDPHVEELSTLREFIEAQRTTSDNRFVLTEGKRAIDLGRSPVTLLENRDFRVYAQGKLLNGLSYTQGAAYISSPAGALEHSARRGETLVIDSGYGLGRYKVLAVRDDKLYVSPRPRYSFSNSSGELVRRLDATLVEIDESAKLPALNDVRRLWCESATVSDYEELEAKYGVIANLSYAQWRALRTGVSYLDIIRAVLLISVRGHAVHSIRDLVSMILGLPYSPTRAVVRRIDQSARQEGASTYDKVVLEDIDRDGNTTGRFSAYYAVSASDANVVDNLGFEDVVTLGATLEAGTVLARGVTVDDNLGDAPTLRHVFDIRIAAGATPIRSEAIKYARERVDALKPAYTDFRVIPEIHVRDVIEIESDVTFVASKRLTDTPYGLHGPAEVLDDFIPGRGRVDTRPFIVLNTWFPHDGVFTQIGDQILVKSQTGGFAAPLTEISRSVFVKVNGALQAMTVRSVGRFDSGDWLKPGDVLMLKDRHDVAPMKIIDIVSDTSIVLDAGAEVLGDLKGVAFIVARYIDDLLLDEADLPIALDESAMIVELGARASGVGRGDLVSFDTSLDAERPIRHMVGTRAVLESRVYPPLSSEATGGGASIRVRRGSLTPEFRGTTLVSDAGIQYAGNVRVASLKDNAEYLGVRVGNHLGPYLVIAIFEDRTSVAVRAGGPLEDAELNITDSQGILGDDALDLADGGVRSSVSIRITMPHPRTLSRVTLNADEAVRNEGGVLDLVDVEQGDIVLFTMSAFNVGEGRGVCRAINSAQDQAGFFDTNAPSGSIPLDGLNYVEVIRQSPIRPYISEVE